MNWQPPSPKLIQRMTALGLYPGIQGKDRVLGCYELPLTENWILIEVILYRPWWRIQLDRWNGVTPRGWSEEHGTPLADFYFDRRGEELIGSYLHDPPNEPVTRLGLLLNAPHEYRDLWHGRGGRIPTEKPIPERLLRLIWLE
jgi:hypothetical protein